MLPVGGRSSLMMNIGKAAKKSGLPVKTVRYYDEINLINPSTYSPTGYRQYDDADVAKLVFVSRARKFRFSISECRELINLYENKERPSSEVKKITLRKIKEIESRMIELTALRTELKSLANSCKGDSRPDCPIIGLLSNKVGGKAI